MALNVDSLVDRLLNVGYGGGLTQCVTEQEMGMLCAAVRQVFLSQPSLLEIAAPVKICGDVHGQYADLLRLLARGGFPPSANYLFLGDYVDRGKQNLETICLLFAFKLKYAENFFLLRGNHECTAINRVYGFYDECQRRYSARLWQTFQETFASMPLTALVGGKILCMHGGLSPRLKHLDQLRNMRRPLEPANPSLEIDLLWSDPDRWASGWKQNTRVVSFVFGSDSVAEACQAFDIDLVARAHQVVQDGFEFFANRRLVTLFSAPHYCGEFNNAAAMMTVDEHLLCSFDMLHPICRARLQ